MFEGYSDERLKEIRLNTLTKRRQDYMNRYKKAIWNNERISAEFYNEKIIETDKLMEEIRAM